MSIRFPWVMLAASMMAVLVILEDYTGYLINQFEYAYSWFSVPSKALSNYWVWALFAPIPDAQARLLVRSKGSKLYRVAGLFMVALVTAFSHRLLAISLFDFVYYLKSGFYTSLLSEKNQQLLFTGWITSLIQYGLILLLFFAVVYYRQFLQKQKELSQAQLRALKMQLHPHFLFNTLHSISSLIDIAPRDAQKMVSRLGALMRNTLEQGEKDSVSLEEEINYVKNYLDIEQVRFYDRLRVSYEIEKEVKDATVPYMLLQPLVENAIKHGIQDMKDGGEIWLSGKLEGVDHVRIVVKDNGEKLKKTRPGSGVGLQNVADRLAAFFDDDYEMKAERIAPQGFEVSIKIPYQVYQS